MIIIRNIYLYVYVCMYVSHPGLNKKAKNNIKECKGYEQAFHMKRNIKWLINIERRSASLLIRKMPIKKLTRHFTPIRLSKLK